MRLLRLTLIAGACLLAAPVLAPGAGPWRAQAGIIILNNGNVFVGRIRKEEDTSETVIMRWPYKHLATRGHQKFEHGAAPHNIRWHRRNTEKEDFDAPTDEYWEQYEDLEKFPVDAKWLPLREKWLLKRKRQEGGADTGLLVIDDPLTKGPRLSPIAVDGGTFKVNKPEGWTSVVEDNIWIFQAKEGKEGYKPRIHVFSGPAVIGQADEQLHWFENRLGRVADKGGFEIKDRAHLKTRPNGFDQVLSSRTVVRGRAVMALRKIFFRNKRTYFFVSYCHESEWPELRPLFERCMSTMEIGEDDDAKKKKAPPVTKNAPQGPEASKSG